EERLKTIHENTALGSGFNIAMKDLEIRGLGNLLGKEQHGHIIAVGFDFYTKMLEDAVRELKGEPLQWRTEPTVIDINIPALIPEDYIPSPYKLEVYRRLSLVSSIDEIEDLKNELNDRFGKIPKEVNNLLRVATLRVLAQRRTVKKISITDDRILLSFREKEDNKVLERLKRFGELKKLNQENWIVRWWGDRLEKLTKLKEVFTVA
ncbi:MAG: TRCF domain-containing protein, partial [bacterium]